MYYPDSACVSIYTQSTKCSNSSGNMFFLGVTGRIINPPSNAVAEVGGQTIFNCTSDTTTQSWIFSTSREEYETSTGQTIVTNCIVRTGFSSNYAVDRPG